VKEILRFSFLKCSENVAKCMVFFDTGNIVHIVSTWFVKLKFKHPKTENYVLCHAMLKVVPGRIRELG